MRTNTQYRHKRGYAKKDYIDGKIIYSKMKCIRLKCTYYTNC